MASSSSQHAALSLTSAPPGISARLACGARLFAGHFDPVHKDPDALADVQRVFERHEVVCGDFNASDYHLRKCGAFDSKGRGWTAAAHERVPTYLPNIDINATNRGFASTKPVFLPGLDNVYVALPARVSPLPAVARWVLPARVAADVNPRSLIRKLGLLSDHVPVGASIQMVPSDAAAAVSAASGAAAPQRWTLATFNVADPFFWARFYPGADGGFDPKREPQRQEKLLSTIADLLERFDALALQEFRWSCCRAWQRQPRPQSGRLRPLLLSRRANHRRMIQRRPTWCCWCGASC